ncbi:MAG: DUF222 domain-containing protein [Pseudolysinimonas sp.]
MSLRPGWIADLTDTSVEFAMPVVANLVDSELLNTQRQLSEVARRINSAAAGVAAEIAHRSRRELGSAGLAQRLGARTPERLVQRVTGSTAREAQTMVRVGTLVANGMDAAASPDSRLDPAANAEPWLSDVAAEVAAGRLSIAVADAIQAGLGPVADATSSPDLVAGLIGAQKQLIRDSPTLTVEQLLIRARELRADLDAEGVRDRERMLRERRYLHITPTGDGMTRINGLLDPESAAVVIGAYDAMTSPRRGGPRFVDPTQATRAEDLVTDSRTLEQIAVDSFVDLIRIATLTDSNDVLGLRRAPVQVIVTERDLAGRRGSGRFEGGSEAVSIDTVERHICESGMVPILFDTTGQAVNVGRDQRLFNRRQRIGMAARDGGCRFPECDYPPSWTEAHHINEWTRDFGRTDIADGILLCRHHHLLVHDNGWRITRTGGDYFAVPPPSIDAHQRPIPAPTKSAALRRLLAS